MSTSTFNDDLLQKSIERESNGLVVTDRRTAAVVAAQPVTDDPLLTVMTKLANNPNLDADKLERLMNVFIDGHRKMAEVQDEKAFANAMADFKKNPPHIVKNRKAKLKGVAKGSGNAYEFEYSYADLNAYCEEAMPMLAERGITWSFPFSEDSKGLITVSCILRYGLYSHTPTTLSGMPEGGSNALQAKGVAVSYLERYTFCGATGLTAAMPDANGQNKPASPEEFMDANQAADFLASIEGSADQGELQANYFKARDAAEAAGDKGAAKTFSEAKNKMYRKLAVRK